MQQLKESPIKNSNNYQISTKISMANDAIQVRFMFMAKILNKKQV